MASKDKSGRGGKREGAGRKAGSGPYGEATKVMRVPGSKVTLIKTWLQQWQEPCERHTFDLEPGFKGVNPITELALPVFSHKVIAGFPSPADDNQEETIDLNEVFVPHTKTSFVVRVQGDSMQQAGILPGDQLVIDRSITPVSGNIVIASVNGDLTLKRLIKQAGQIWLYPENPAYQPIAVAEETELVIWGVVVSVLRKLI
ncbi:LexA family protein [Thiomicrospira cyclica]|uniref:Peptidase S24/S26A/S26B, conserved region n=1 Tax=Thiomicrospira cyclica (strain DSM 14477 / JCM 11371 / ALM1) TaxID=717773 RepID=F6DCM5_THICA|nr:translesion error-prone DNA polymerase V autoproteolytic subunit [Thiomicrospira cyclica]AEG31611.1 Peptidase S24/S26A/S26B, conserved region [Thiomicrospira cyclica ALM1]